MTRPLKITTPMLMKSWATIGVVLISLTASWSVMAQTPVCTELPLVSPTLPDKKIEAGVLSIMDNGGIGGTGNKADAGGVGIIGTITGFASICLNGQEVHYDATTPVSRNGVSTHFDALAVGQIAAIDAVETPKGWVARQIHLINVLEGPITHTATENGSISVMNQSVVMDASTRLGGFSQLDQLKLETPVRIAGFRDTQGQIHATRIEMAPDLMVSSSIGMPTQGSTNPITSADEMLVRGHWNGQQLESQSTQPSPATPFTTHGHRVIVESMILESKNPTHLRVTGFDVSLDKRTQMPNVPNAPGNQPMAEGQRILITGHMDGKHHIVAETIVFSSPRSFDSKHTLMPMPKQGGSMPSDQPMMIDRMKTPDMPQRMNSTPMPHPPRMPPGSGMPQMPKM